MTRHPGSPLSRALALAALVAGARPAPSQVTELGLANVLGASANFNTGIGFGARALGMAGAFTAIADDATAASWNPGGLAQLDRSQVSMVVGVSGAELSSNREGIGRRNTAGLLVGSEALGRDYSAKGYGLDFLSVVQPFRLGSQPFTGLLSYSRFGRPVNVDARLTDAFFDEPGVRPAGLNTQRFSISSTGALDSAALGLATSFREKVFVGVTANLWFGKTKTIFEGLTENRNILPDGTRVLNAAYTRERVQVRDVSGFSANVGVLYKPIPSLSLGLVYRGGWAGSDKVSDSVTDDGFDTFVRTAPSGASVSEFLPFRSEGSFTRESRLKWPDSFGGGIAYRPLDPLTVAFDGTVARWSRAESSPTPYLTDPRSGCTGPAGGERRCTVVFEGTRTDYPSLLRGVPQNDQVALRAGAEYLLRVSDVIVPLRIGGYRVTTLSPLFGDRDQDAATFGRAEGDQDRKTHFTGLSVGAGAAVPAGGWTVLLDVAAVFDRATSTYDSRLVRSDGISEEGSGERTFRGKRFVSSLIVRF